ncbi:MAG TPA: type I-B CRISPR-associated endonuclease Cas1b [Blastocatellia bacterium]|nr:type I-B CRISPR-associated endonuclease Cas1b [Blastocatellia bacterium]
MARHYYLTRSGRLRRKDNTLAFEPVPEKEKPDDGAGDDGGAAAVSEALMIGPVVQVADYEMGDLALDPEGDEAGEAEADAAMTMELAEENEEPVRVSERRVIPVEDVDALWVFRELDLNARVLVFLGQKKIPAHFFNYYGFYAGSFYPREYLQAGYLTVRQVRHYSNRRLRLKIAREFIAAAMHNILRNLRYYGTRGIELQAETETVQAEMLRLEAVRDVAELMGCEGRARAAYYQGFNKILRERFEFTKRTRRPPDNLVNAMISYANGLVYSSCLTQLYRSQLDPTISFLHEPGVRRFSLALDLAEVFKPLLADRLIFKMLNNRMLSERDFAQDLNCCYLKDAGRKIVLKEWDARLQTTIEHRRLKRKVSYERLIRLECYKLVKYLMNDESYVGFRAWW